ncbi:MAG TPA: hypothetical protein VNZ45_13535, partial [Bacteroidia bacterium]|nr:hypothetical protein [Bacteroidia bacterium]
DVEWDSGWDFIELQVIARGTPLLRDLAKNYEEGDSIKKLHETGVQLTYSEPVLIFDANSKTNKGSIHRLLWDGTCVPDAIAPNFTTFFEHWLATGCFHGRDFKAYWEIVKDIVPAKIPAKDNLWLKYYTKQYADAAIE